MQLLKNKKNNHSGFTLMETLVAIFILLLALTGPMVFAQYGLRSAFLSRDQITAFFLAQDAIEYIKNIRNGNAVEIVQSQTADPSSWLNHPDSNGTLNNLLTLCSYDTGCSIDTLANNDGTRNIKSCSTETIPGCVNDSDTNKYTPLNYYQSDSKSYFTNDVGANITPSLFAREIKLKKVDYGSTPTTPNNENIEVEATVIVRWKSHEGIGVREIKVRENIFNLAHALLN